MINLIMQTVCIVIFLYENHVKVKYNKKINNTLRIFQHFTATSFTHLIKLFLFFYINTNLIIFSLLFNKFVNLQKAIFSPLKNCY